MILDVFFEFVKDYFFGVCLQNICYYNYDSFVDMVMVIFNYDYCVIFEIVNVLVWFFVWFYNFYFDMFFWEEYGF